MTVFWYIASLEKMLYNIDKYRCMLYNIDIYIDELKGSKNAQLKSGFNDIGAHTIG